MDVRDFLVRFAAACVGIPLLIVLLLVRDGFPFVIALSLVSMIGLREFYQGIRKTGASPQDWVGMASSLLFVFAARNEYHTERFGLSGILTIFVIVSLSFELLRKDRDPVKNLGSTFLGAIYVGWLFSYLVAIRSLQGTFHFNRLSFVIPSGAWLVLFVVFAAWAADTGSYLVGGKWGTHKMTPTISPGKTWEGCFAGIASSVIVALVMGCAMHMSWQHSLIAGFGISIASVIGDLAESSIKRSIGIKDFGSLLLAHGGILDRFDGLLFAAPLFYYYLKIFVGY